MPTSPPTPQSSSPSRYGWVDFAKGFCIIAVVALWVNRGVGVGQGGWLSDFVAFAKPFRMPDFFLISGLFLSRVLHRPWVHYLDTKVMHYLYFLVLWTLLIIPGMWVLKDNWPDSSSAAVAQLLHGLYHPVAMLWFLPALATYFIAARLLQPVPKIVVTIVAAILMVISPETGIPYIDWFCAYFVFFQSGYAYAERFFSLADWARAHPRTTWTLIPIWALVNVAVLKITGGQSLLAMLVLGYLGICALVMASSLLSTRPAFAWLTHLGKNSIAVYLGFYLLLHGFLEGVSHLPELAANKPVVATLAWVLCVAGAMAVFHGVQHTPLRYLFVRPSWAKLTHWNRGTPVSRVSPRQSHQQ